MTVVVGGNVGFVVAGRVHKDGGRDMKHIVVRAVLFCFVRHLMWLLRLL